MRYVCGSFLLAIAAFAAHAQSPERVFSIADQLVYDDNLFRLPGENSDVGTLVDPNARREDYINRLSAAFNGEWEFARQAVSLSMQVSDNRFKNNDTFDYLSTKNGLKWNWIIGSRLSGNVGGDYSRTLANFANNLVFERDILESRGYFGGFRYRIGNHWRLKVTGRQSDVDHDLVSRRFDNASVRTGTGGIEYETSAKNLLGWDYRYVDGRFPQDTGGIAGRRSPREYLERGALGRIEYAFTDKTSLDANAGYVRRDYPQDPDSDFSGEVWHASLRWLPRDKIELSVSGWREPRANQDAESDYFVSRGWSAELTWLLREKLELSLESTVERRQYLLATGVAGADGRRDTVDSAQGFLTYQPRRWLALNTSFGYEHRDSSRGPGNYAGWVAGFGVKTLF